jgi:subtilisin-like proprotein convertase family protein
MRTSMRHHSPSKMLMTLGLMVSLVMLALPLGHIMTTAQASKIDKAGRVQQDKNAGTEKSAGSGTYEIVRSNRTKAENDLAAAQATRIPPGTDLASEVEPNNTPASAHPLTTTPVRIRGDLFSAPFVSAATVDVDIYSVTAGAGDKLFAATMTGFSGGSTDTLLDVLASDGTTVLDTDDEDGTVSASSSNVAGVTLATAGTYYVRVRQFVTSSLSGSIRPYDLYVRVLSGSPTPEVEPNNNAGPPNAPNPLPANGWVSGRILASDNPPGPDTDTYSVAGVNAGDTIIAIMDVDPERDAPEWNARLGIGLFNNNYLLANGGGVGGTFDDANPSEALMMTAKTSGTYQFYVDPSPVATGCTPNPPGCPQDGVGLTYTLSVSIIPAMTRKCTSYAGTTGPIADLATTNFTVAVTNPATVSNLQLTMSATHTATADLDISLLAPDGNEVVLADDPATAAGAGAPQINWTLDDEAGIPAGVFGIHSGMHYTPELFARLGFFKGQQAMGTWTLRIRDDLTANTGTLNSWSLNVCEDPSLACPALLTMGLFSEDFESGAGGFTHSGTQDEWELGLPSALSAPITTCHSGTNCWKTDLDNTYNNSSNQNLLSPPIDLTALAGRAITAEWWQKYNIESASFDPAWVEVREVGNPTNFRKLWEWKGATMSRSVGNPAVTVQASAGWGLMEYDISDFGGKMVELRFHLETDTSGQFSGLAIDDVTVRACKKPSAGDFSGNGPSDFAVYRPGPGIWYILNNDGTSSSQQFGAPNDKIVPADYDGDGDIDIAVWRPSEGNWYISNGSAQDFTRIQWGINGDIPVPGDYDGDGRADVAVFRPGAGTWYILGSTAGFQAAQWGIATDRPVAADYDGDGRTDIAVWRPSEGNWYILQSFTGGVRASQFGIASDYPVPTDYDGDRKADLAVYRDGTWYILLSTSNALRATQLGGPLPNRMGGCDAGDIPQPTDYDGDRKSDIGVFHTVTGEWIVQRSTNGSTFGVAWGSCGDIPAAYIPEQ